MAWRSMILDTIEVTIGEKSPMNAWIMNELCRESGGEGYGGVSRSKQSYPEGLGGSDWAYNCFFCFCFVLNLLFITRYIGPEGPWQRLPLPLNGEWRAFLNNLYPTPD